MADANLAIHYVCTHEQAEALIRERSRFWLSNCGCREEKGTCSRSRIDVCLIFNYDDPGSGGDKKEITINDALEVLKEAREKFLVARPFRNLSRTETDGICFCCDDCCGYFIDPSETCDKGDLIAETNMDTCMHCGACEEVCYFKARGMVNSALLVELDACCGCGLCVTVCPVDSIKVVKRQKQL